MELLVKAALELQATSMALQLTQAALNAQQAVQPTSPPPQPTIAQPEAPAQVQPTPTQDVEARIRAANVLVYENTDEYGIGMWIQDALDNMGIKYTQTGSYSGHFMEYLNSGTKYDLIIVGAEAKDRISGEFWDVINPADGRWLVRAGDAERLCGVLAGVERPPGRLRLRVDPMRL